MPPKKDTQFNAIGVLEAITELKSAINHLEEKIDTVDTKVEKLHDLMADPEKGVIIEVDRLKQDAKKRSWLNKTLIASLIAAAGGFIWAAIKNIIP
jgi:predicted methyltransferase MtxX (methanogen marker protein 4)